MALMTCGDVHRNRHDGAKRHQPVIHKLAPKDGASRIQVLSVCAHVSRTTMDCMCTWPFPLDCGLLESRDHVLLFPRVPTPAARPDTPRISGNAYWGMICWTAWASSLFKRTSGSILPWWRLVALGVMKHWHVGNLVSLPGLKDTLQSLRWPSP